MILVYNLTQNLVPLPPNGQNMMSNINKRRNPQWQLQIVNSEKKKFKCLRCNTLYQDKDNSPTACFFHGHTNGEKGLLALAPPHQGIDREWMDRSGVIVYKWNEKNDRPNTGRANWKKRWSCCSEYDENAPPCRQACCVWNMVLAISPVQLFCL